jgi:hypothetical protein
MAAMLYSLKPGDMLTYGDRFSSPGGHFSYRVIGACCRLFDREQLPWPCCRLQWHSKEPSWRRIGRRFVVDFATRGHPSYSVEILDQRPDSPAASSEPLVVTLYWLNLPQPLKDWWYADKLRTTAPLVSQPPTCMNL